MKKYNPYKIGKQLRKDGYGISDIATAVKCDADIEEAYRGYCDQQRKAEDREERRLVSSKLGYSRIGLNNWNRL